MEASEVLTTTALLAAAQHALLEADYKILEDLNAVKSSPADRARLFQNRYSVVMLATFETWENLVNTWPDYQSITVEAMSQFLRQGEAKAADGYLVLLTPSPVPAGQISEANQIRSDTSRLRKLLGTAEELRTISDVRKVLASLLPLSIRAGDGLEEGGLDALPRILQEHGVEAAATKIAVDAFKANAPIMPRLHDFRHAQ
jgi:hypothetical protein